MNRYLALIHHPIINKRGEKVTTSVTNLDIHDIARSCRTFGIKNYFIVTPIEKQHELINELLSYWKEDFANEYNPDRSDALAYIKCVNSLEDVTAYIKESEQRDPIISVTGANFKEDDGSLGHLSEIAAKQSRPTLLCFGTGWGLHQEILDKAEFLVSPIRGLAKDGYNHLSVRSAVAIYLSQF